MIATFREAAIWWLVFFILGAWSNFLFMETMPKWLRVVRSIIPLACITNAITYLVDSFPDVLPGRAQALVALILVGYGGGILIALLYLLWRESDRTDRRVIVTLLSAAMVVTGVLVIT